MRALAAIALTGLWVEAAAAAEPPTCADMRVETAIQDAYAEMLAKAGGTPPRFKLDTMREVGFLPGEGGMATRYCLAGIMVYGDAPAEDAGHVRVEGFGAGDTEFGVFACFLSEGGADGCTEYRPAE